MPIQLVPVEVQEFLTQLEQRYPCKIPFKLCYLWGHGETLPVVEMEGEQVQRHGGYCPEDGCAIVMGIDPDTWDSLKNEKEENYFESREAAMRYVLETIAHEYAHHLQHQHGVLPFNPTDESEAEAERMTAEMLETIL